MLHHWSHELIQYLKRIWCNKLQTMDGIPIHSAEGRMNVADNFITEQKTQL